LSYFSISFYNGNVYPVPLYLGSVYLVFVFVLLLYGFRVKSLPGVSNFEFVPLNNVSTIKTSRTLGDEYLALCVDISLLGPEWNV
jgi:hypothetical protein